jgi:hypothetical protein
MNKVKRHRTTYSTRQRIYNVVIIAMVAVVVIGLAVAASYYVSQMIRINLVLTDETVACLYIVALLFEYLVVSWLLPRTKHKGAQRATLSTNTRRN